MNRIHFTDKYLINPQHPVTVYLIGVGGTGSQVLTCLARIDSALRSLGHPGLYVKAWDNDEVTQANIGRQLFSPADIGLNKAVCLVTRVNRFFGLAWEAEPLKFSVKENGTGNLFITCTDTASSRYELWTGLKKYGGNNHCRSYSTPLYWLDFGNTQTAGQVVLGTVSDIEQPESEIYETASKLDTIAEITDLSKTDEKDSGPSCSLAEALNKQDLFINSTLAQLGCNVLWKLFRNMMIDTHGLYLNLETMKVNPIKL